MTEYKSISDDNDESRLLAEDQPDLPSDVVVIEKEKVRNLVAFWMLGLCNNFVYVVMLSAAFDILKDQSGKPDKDKHTTGFICHSKSTGIVLLADVLPTLVIKLTAPFYMQRISYHFRVAFVIVFSLASLITVALSPNEGISLLGVVFASASSGAGEITFLSITSHFKKTTVSAWSSGTGMAGVAGALSYAGLTQLGLSSKNTLLLLLIVPALIIGIFWILLELPAELKIKLNNESKALTSKSLMENQGIDKTKYMLLKMKMMLVVPLLKYMVPLCLVYLAEYTINQGLFELLYYKMSWLNQSQQYRWFQVTYQIGVFISRSSVNLFQIRKLLIPVVIQFCILIFFTFEIVYTFVPSFWITLAIVLIEGFCGGAVYVNAFYMITENVKVEVREFCMGVASVADSLGIVVAGVIATPIHNSLCKIKV